MNSFLNLIRIKHYIKNLLIFAGLVFTFQLFNYSALLKVSITFIYFCIASSAVYIFNDIIDLEYDKKHPHKKHRPLPSGQISKYSAIILLVLFYILSLSAFIFDIEIGFIILSFLIMNLLYTLFFKNMPILDLLIVSLGYVLRVLAGILIIRAYISPWIVIAVFNVGMLMITSKRYVELIKQKNTRKVITKYDKEFLLMTIIIFTTATILVYLLWTIENRLRLNQVLLISSSFFVIFGILRYVFLTIKGLTEPPIEIILKDRQLQIIFFIWALYMISLIYALSFF